MTDSIRPEHLLNDMNFLYKEIYVAYTIWNFKYMQLKYVIDWNILIVAILTCVIDIVISL